MPFKTAHAIFYHIHKTGGTWVKRAMKQAGVPRRECQTAGVHPLIGHTRAHATPRMTSEEDKKDRFSFCFVRHPAAWYRSMWMWIPNKTRPYDGPLGDYWSDDFGEWVEMMIDAFPGGFVSQLYSLYVLDVDFVGRTEQLEDGLVYALTQAGERFIEPILRAVPPQNVRASRIKHIGRGIVTPELRQRIENAERWTMDRFYR